MQYCVPAAAGRPALTDAGLTSWPDKSKFECQIDPQRHAQPSSYLLLRFYLHTLHYSGPILNACPVYNVTKSENHCRPAMTVGELKVVIGDKEGILPAQQRLIYAGKHLHNDCSLACSGVDLNVTLILVLQHCPCFAASTNITIFGNFQIFVRSINGKTITLECRCASLSMQCVARLFWQPSLKSSQKLCQITYNSSNFKQIHGNECKLYSYSLLNLYLHCSRSWAC